MALATVVKAYTGVSDDEVIEALEQDAGTTLLSQSSLKAALDCDWDNPRALPRAVEQVLVALETVEGYVAAQPPTPSSREAQASVAVAQEVVAQDLVQHADGTVALRRVVAKARRISIATLRHGAAQPSLLRSPGRSGRSTVRAPAGCDRMELLDLYCFPDS